MNQYETWNRVLECKSKDLQQEAHGPQHSPEKTSWKSINTYDYHNVDKEKKISSFTLWELNGSSFEQIEFPSPKDALWQVWLKLVQWFLRKRFLNFVNVFLLFSNYLPLEKDGGLHLNKFESPSPKDALWQVWLKLV